MSDLLAQLYRLQSRIRFVQERERKRDTVPAELVEVDREFQEKVKAVAALKQRLTEAELEKRKAEGELADHREKLKKYQTQLRSVQSSREYSAALNEIDAVEKAIRATEDRFLDLEEEIETAKKDLALMAACRSRLVAAITRTSARIRRLPPTRSNSCSCKTRRSAI